MYVWMCGYVSAYLDGCEFFLSCGILKQTMYPKKELMLIFGTDSGKLGQSKETIIAILMTVKRCVKAFCFLGNILYFAQFEKF